MLYPSPLQSNHVSNSVLSTFILKKNFVLLEFCCLIKLVPKLKSIRTSCQTSYRKPELVSEVPWTEGLHLRWGKTHNYIGSMTCHPVWGEKIQEIKAITRVSWWWSPPDIFAELSKIILLPKNVFLFKIGLENFDLPLGKKSTLYLQGLELPEGPMASQVCYSMKRGANTQEPQQDSVAWPLAFKSRRAISCRGIALMESL